MTRFKYCNVGTKCICVFMFPRSLFVHLTISFCSFYQGRLESVGCCCCLLLLFVVVVVVVVVAAAA